MRWFHLGKIRLHPSISTAFLLLMVPSILGIVWFVYARNSAAITELAGKSMQQATAAAIEHTLDHLDSVSSLVSTLAAFGEREPALLQRPDMGNLLLSVLKAYPQVDSLYAGFEETGNFAEAVRLPSEQKKYGPNDRPIPLGAVYVVRYLNRARGRTPSDHYSYLSDNGTIIFDETALNVAYDPRTRPFYVDALAKPDAAALSDVYAFASTGRPGITISRTVRNRTGNIIGVAGADFTIANIAAFLRSLAPSEHGVTMIVDDRQRIVAHPGGDNLIGATADSIGNPAVASALRSHTYSGSPARISYKLGGGEEYSASFTPFPTSFDRRWELMMVVPIDDFVGSLKRTTRQVLSIGFVVLLIGIVGIRVLSKGLTRPIERLIQEAERIRRLELEGDIITPRAAVREIVQLIESVRTMKAALHSFGLFVPKALVRDLLASGRNLERGGESRKVTILFTDLVNFSTLAEAVSASDLAARTSDYLEDVSQEVIRYRGTIDKYIGDAVMALWNAPVFDDDHIAHACYAALHAQKRLEVSNLRWSEEGWPPIAMRIGVHTNDVVVGIIGSTEHMSYTALGDGVNIASRLEGINKVYGTHICVSHTVYQAVADRFLMRPLDYAAVKGRKEQIAIYELMGALDDPDAEPTPEQHVKAVMTREAFAAWRQHDLSRARELYNHLLAKFPDDTLAQIYVNRCETQLRIDNQAHTQSTVGPAASNLS